MDCRQWTSGGPASVKEFAEAFHIAMNELRERDMEPMPIEVKTSTESAEAIIGRLPWRLTATEFRKWHARADKSGLAARGHQNSARRPTLEKFLEANREAHSRTYEDVITSDDWHSLRRRMIANADNRCQVCNYCDVRNDQFQLHHRRYGNTAESMLDEKELIVVCTRCHKYCDALRIATKKADAADCHEPFLGDWCY